MDNVLSRFLGTDFEKLAPLLRRAHSGTTRLTGAVSVAQGGLLSKIIGKVLGFPRAGADVSLTVNCFHYPDRMEWVRNFDGLIMASRFRRRGDFLIEALGPVSIFFSPKVVDGALDYRFIKARFCGIPIPRLLTPVVVARESEVAGAYCFEVDVKMPLVGRLIAYGGILQLDIIDD